MPNKNTQPAFSTLYELCSYCATHFQKQTAIEEKHGDFYKGHSYAKLCGDAKKLGAALCAKLGCRAHVMLIGENGYDLVLSYLAVTAYVGTAVPMPVFANAENTADAVKLCDVSAVIYGDAASELVLALGEDIEKIPFSSLGELIKNAPSQNESFVPSPDDAAELAYTYGGEESARAVILTHKNICFSIGQMARMLPLGTDDKLYSVLPTAYSYERICGTLYPLSRGACVTYGEGLRHLSTNLRRVSPTAMLCVPLILDRIYGKIWANIEKKGIGEKVRRAIKLTAAAGPLRTAVRKQIFAEIHDSLGGRLSVLICGGGAPSSEAVFGLREFGIRALACYGAVETASVMCANRKDLHEYTSLGMPVPDGLVDIYNMQSDGIGEVRYKGDNVTPGYYKNDAMSAGIIRGGWFYTGDMGYFDRRGFLHTVGKKSNMILRAKRRAVFPEELESKLCESPFVAEAVVIGENDTAHGDYDIVAVIEPDTENLMALYGEELTREQLENEIKNAVDNVNATLEPYKHISRAVISDTKLEKNELGKIVRSKVSAKA